MKHSEVNHLRRLLGWVRCEAGQTPDEYMATMRKIAPAFDDGVSEEGKQRLMAGYDKSRSIPKYVWAAIKALEPLVRGGETVDAEQSTTRELSAPAKRLPAP